MLDILRKRRSIRKYEDRPIEPGLVEQLKEAALRAPTGNNKREWRFVFVTDRDLLGQLAHAKPQWGEFLANAPLGVVVAADETASDVWIEDCSIAATVLQLTATSLGLGSCWIQMRERVHEDGRPSEEHVRELVGLGPEMRVDCILAIGHPAEEKPQWPADKLPWESVEVL